MAREQESLAVGGQAVVEGVMMRNKDLIATSVRSPKGEIITKKEKYRSWTKRISLLGWPIIRGMVNLIEILILGMKIMIWSSNQQLEEEEEFTKKELFITIGLALLFSIVVFKLLPLLFATFAQQQLQSNNFVFNLLDGVAKLGILLIYLWLIGKMKDVQRLFQYHGAEHKTINCYEEGKKITVANVMKCTRFHPRCGTSFILFVFLVSILLYMLIPLEFNFWAKLGVRLLFMPVIAGISYEIIKFAGKHHERLWMKPILWPGLALQRLTTKDPDKKQVAVAIKSVKSVL